MPRTTGLPPITELQFQKQVWQLAKLRGWRVAQFRAAKTEAGWRTPVSGDGQGWPDMTLVRDSRIVFVELKSQRGKPSPEQEVWLEALRKTPAEVYCWRPSDWDSILEILS